MSAHTAIEWTDATWNPTRGCSKAGPECDNCYAMEIAHRFSGPGKPFEGLTRVIDGRGQWNGTLRTVPGALALPVSWVKPRRIFVDSMSDLFHERVPFEFIAQVFAVMAATTRHTYQVLTKRPERMLAFVAWLWEDFDRAMGWPNRISPSDVLKDWTPYQPGRRGGYDNCGPNWPLENVWLGVSIGEQRGADQRREPFRALGWPQKFVSYEPAIGSVDWAGWDFVQWIISGGESGRRARPSDPDWHRATRNFCQQHGIAYFFKQWGSYLPVEFTGDEMWAEDGSERQLDGRIHVQHAHGQWFARRSKHGAGRLLDGRTWDEIPITAAEARQQQRRSA